MIKTDTQAFTFRKPSLGDQCVEWLHRFTSQGDVPPVHADQGALVARLKRDGYVLLDRYIPSDRLRALKAAVQKAFDNLQFEMPCLAQARIDPVRHADIIERNLCATPQELAAESITFDRDEAQSFEQVIQAFKPSTLTLPLSVLPEVFWKTWLDPYLLTVVANYMGVIPQMVEAYVRRNYLARFRYINHSWHRDLNHRRHLLKIFFFLSDCTDDTGPHEFIRGSHVDYGGFNGKRYYSNDEIEEAYPLGSDDRVVSVVNAGSVVIEDTRGLHRARVPRIGHRDLGFAVFFPSTEWRKYYDVPGRVLNDLSSFQRSFIPTAAPGECACDTGKQATALNTG